MANKKRPMEYPLVSCSAVSFNKKISIFLLMAKAVCPMTFMSKTDLNLRTMVL